MTTPMCGICTVRPQGSVNFYAGLLPDERHHAMQAKGIRANGEEFFVPLCPLCRDDHPAVAAKVAELGGIR